MMTLVTGRPFAVLAKALPTLSPRVAIGSLSNQLKIFISFGQLMSIVPANLAVLILTLILTRALVRLSLSFLRCASCIGSRACVRAVVRVCIRAYRHRSVVAMAVTVQR